MSFQGDLEESKKYVSKVISQLSLIYGITLENNPETKGVDLIHDLLRMEVKYDKRVEETGNVFIEVSCSGVPSGVFAYDCDYFIIGGEKDFAIVRLPILQEYITKGIICGEFELKKAGDGWRVRGVAIPYESLCKIASSVIEFGKKKSL